MSNAFHSNQTNYSTQRHHVHPLKDHLAIEHPQEAVLRHYGWTYQKHFSKTPCIVYEIRGIFCIKSKDKGENYYRDIAKFSFYKSLTQTLWDCASTF
jgi:hypothetical protein